MIELLSVFKGEYTSLTELIRVKCSADHILLKGRYVKLARDVSQTPWNLTEEDDGDQVSSGPLANRTGIKSV